MARLLIATLVLAIFATTSNAALVYLNSSDLGLDVNTAAAGNWTVTNLGDKVGIAALEGFDLNIAFAPGSGNPKFDIPVDSNTNVFNLIDGKVTVSLVHAASGNPVEIDLAFKAGGNLSIGEKDSFGPTADGSLVSPTSVPAGVTLLDDSVENTSGSNQGVGDIIWQGRGTEAFIQVDNGGAWTVLGFDADTLVIIPAPAALPAGIVLLGLVAMKRRK